jgi:hypothetical protein
MNKRMDPRFAARYLKIQGEVVYRTFHAEIPVGRAYLLGDPEKTPLTKIPAGKNVVIEPAATIEPDKVIVECLTHPAFCQLGDAVSYRKYLPVLGEKADLSFLYFAAAETDLAEIPYAVRLLVEEGTYPKWK